MMANIQEILTKILSSKYGKDMRQAIHDGIEQCYDDVTNPDLNVDAFEKAIQNKIDSGELATMTIPDGSITKEKLDSGVSETIKQNAEDVTDLKNIVNDAWSDVIIGEVFENDEIIEPELPYKEDGLDTYINFTHYPDGFSEKIGDLTDNNTEIITTGTDLYTSGRNGMVGGKFMVNKGPLSNSQGSGLTINTDAIRTYPFSIEIYAHLRRDYDPYAGNEVLRYESTAAIQNYQAALFSTQYTLSGESANGLYAFANKEKIGIIGSINTPSISENVTGLEIDGIQNENIGDRYDHIVVCLESNRQKFYLNNKLIIDKEEKSVSLSIRSVLRILPGYLRGDIKLIRIYKGTLSNDDVAMNYSSAVGGTGNES